MIFYIITGVRTTFIILHSFFYCKFIYFSLPKGGGFHPSRNYKLKLNRSINLRQQPEYPFIKDDDAFYLEDRFLLSATAAATGIEQPESSIQLVIQQTPDGAILILSGNDIPLRSIKITDAQGRILATEANAQSPYIYKVTAPGIYIVRISGESGITVKKIIIKPLLSL
jgi:hypothetical protein